MSLIPCHYLYDQFIRLYRYDCREDVCDALRMADEYSQGFVVNEAKRDRFILYLTAHFMELAVVSASDRASRITAMSQGEAFSRVKGEVKLNNDEWWGLSIFGQMALDLLDQNARTGVMII